MIIENDSSLAQLHHYWNRKVSYYLIVLVGEFRDSYKYLKTNRSSLPKKVYEKGVLKNFTKCAGKDLCRRLFSSKIPGLSPATLYTKRLKKEVFSCEFWDVFMNTFFNRTPPEATSKKHTSIVMACKACLKLFCFNAQNPAPKHL